MWSYDSQWSNKACVDLIVGFGVAVGPDEAAEAAAVEAAGKYIMLVWLALAGREERAAGSPHVRCNESIGTDQQCIMDEMRRLFHLLIIGVDKINV